MLTQRDIKEEKLSLDEAESIASKYLESRGYDNMVAIETDSYQGLGVFTFASEQDGVIIYPDAITVKVALDNGEVAGFYAAEYLMNHRKRSIPKAKVTAKQARTMVNPSLRVSDQRLAIIEGKNDGKEVLCYEFTTEFEDNTYMIYINAQSGEEEEVHRMETEGEDETA